MNGMYEPDLECIVCGITLTGRQRLYCCGKCKKRAQRHPERYPKPERPPAAPPAPQPTATAQPEPADPKPRRARAGIADAAATGDREKILAALRQHLAHEIDNCDDPRAVASLTARLVDVIDRIAPGSESTTKGGGALDEIAHRRAQREARRAPTA